MFEANFISGLKKAAPGMGQERPFLTGWKTGLPFSRCSNGIRSRGIPTKKLTRGCRPRITFVFPGQSEANFILP